MNRTYLQLGAGMSGNNVVRGSLMSSLPLIAGTCVYSPSSSAVTKPKSKAQGVSAVIPRTAKRNLLLFLSLLFLRIPASLPAQVQSLVENNTTFAFDLYETLASTPGNLFFSPYSISTCLAMIYDGARGNTAAQMSQVLGFETNQQQFASTFGQLQGELAADQQTNAIELNIANALWTQVGFPFLPTFLQTVVTRYQANVNQADFAYPDVVRQTINDWVAQQTRNRIQNILPPGAINPDIRLVLANAIYFLASWSCGFAETNTSPRPFYLSSTEEVQAPLLHRPPDLPINYAQIDDFQALELPYGSNQLSMLILLPSRIDGLAHLEQQLCGSLLSNVLAQLVPQTVEVFLPRFSTESLIDLKRPLEQMGMTDAFTPSVADFSGMDGQNDLFISFVLHKAWVQVNETGTEAAAATIGGGPGCSGGESRPPPPIFRADHAFIFIIRDVQTSGLLFMGRLTNPTGSAGTPVPIPKMALTASVTDLIISWPYASPWVLEQSADLSATNWTPVPPVIGDGNGGYYQRVMNDETNNNLRVNLSPGNLFFRLRRQ
jgi:serpin B